ncbi:aspartyl-tRNA(Asn)/glutamyl-tRNA(Gln) amidotransferase subunit A [Novosphingobium sp. CF614]|uniref:AtzE family amidohydrolase n=1 Tax=Novosphingobium sp. CF614 TaxID=1884364 RepID=UPI0008E6CA9C|nr:AtzE family amidohydrolase [Novosphingobium sp. CF614]SFG18086.1 aspartyl-tRNA(Asn)/glutamyl-tRNA(Gln) amidotransferase subunit A [Novosphingobium sp. CF614]
MIATVSQAAAETAGAASIAARVREGGLSAIALVEGLLARIAERDRALNCFTQVMADRALGEAAAIDAIVAAGRDPGPLAGVPFGVKDNYDVAGRVTTAGSIINRSLAPAAADAVLIRRLNAAGAVLVGTQNMDEFAYGFTTENAHYGATRNPLDPARSAGGSSGGSAAAVAAGLVQFALGTDTNGSIRVPASFCGLFGLKPTFGRLPRTGTFPFVHDLDHLGPFARSAADLALIYDVLQGHDAGDLACADLPPSPVSPFLAEPLGGSVAVLDGWFDDLADAQGREAVARVAGALGARARVTLPGAAEARAAAFVLTCASGGNLHFEKLRTHAADFDPATRDRLLAGTLVPANAVLQAQRCRTVFRDQLLEAFRHHALLIAPATPCSAPLLGQATIQVAGADIPTRANIGLLTQPLSFVGVPIVAVPVRSGALPIAVQLIAPPWREDLAMRAAAALERAGVAGTCAATPGEAL